MARRTLGRAITASGIALHAGAPVTMTLSPAAPKTGIVFWRRDVLGSTPVFALWPNVTETRLGTVITGDKGETIAVIEHLMAALAGADIDDCVIELDGPEPPILDGDALSYLELIERAGVVEQEGRRLSIEILKPVSVSSSDASCSLAPAARSEFAFEISFPSSAIGTQSFSFVFDADGFRREIAPARTFGFLHEADRLRAAGLARGADLTNTLVIDGDRLVNEPLRRFPDEFVRHKILDAIGDLKLAGGPVLGRFEGRRSSHALNNALLLAVFADKANYRLV